MDDESSSGVNLTTANHAVFVHPLLAIGQQQYDAYETQVLFCQSISILNEIYLLRPDKRRTNNNYLLSIRQLVV